MNRTPRNRKERERDVRVIVQGSPQEIAALAEALQERRGPKRVDMMVDGKTIFSTAAAGAKSDSGIRLAGSPAVGGIVTVE